MPSRREFLRHGCCAALGAGGFLSALAQLRVIGAVAADSTAARATAAAVPPDYKALVCVFLMGGNDANNVIVPYDQASYNAYAATRGGLAVERASLQPITPATYTDGRSYAMPTAVTELRDLFTRQKAAVLANVGTLVQPTTLAQYRSGTALPRQLFAHNEQSMQWHSSIADRPFTTGWGGRLADLLLAFESNPQVSMSISLDGPNSFQIGNTQSQLTVSPGGVRVRAEPSDPDYQAEKRLFALPQSNLLQAALGGATQYSYAQSEILAAALQGAPTLGTTFPGSLLAQQLAMVARLISVASSFGLRRQVFFVRSNGWDTHNLQNMGHGMLLTELSGALGAFYNATVELGVANQVTTFTASDFGRTFNSNGDGTDHGWGAHHFIIGGAVRGGDIYGTMPSLALGGPDDTGQGRWLPSTSVDEYNATLATWFGVSASNLPTVLPNIGRFARPNLGFL